MSTILEIKNDIAANLGTTVSAFTVNGRDLALGALNRVRRNFELSHDFNFQRKLLTLSLNSITGGSLDSAVLYGTATTADIKQIVDIGQLDDQLNLRPLDWTTTEEAIERQRGEYDDVPRYPSDAEVRSALTEPRRLTITNNQVYIWPKPETSETLSIAIEAYVFSSDWTTLSNTIAVTGGTGVTAVNTTYYRYGSYNSKPLYISLADAGTPSALYYIWYSGTAWIINQLPGTAGSNYHTLTSTSQSPAGSYTGNGTYTGTAVATSSEADSTSDVWTTKGEQALMWGAVVELNKRFKYYVPRTEGNLPPPTDLMQQGLQSLLDWDIFKYEQRRRHGR